MIFNIIARDGQIPPNSRDAAFLRTDHWDDWARWRTQFQLTVFDREGVEHWIGSVKIGRVGLLPGAQVDENTRAPQPPVVFPTLPDDFFSVGQDETYYEALNALPGNLRLVVLESLRDFAYDLEIFNRVSNEPVTTGSLLRGIQVSNVVNRFHRLSRGDATLTPFQFQYIYPHLLNTDAEQAILVDQVNPERPILEFRVRPNSVPPTNVHVLIGRNGVGKSTCMQNMGKALLNIRNEQNDPGSIVQLGDGPQNWSFAGLVSISFSAFDDFEFPVAPDQEIVSHIVGLRYRTDEGETLVKTPERLAEDFSNSFASCRSGLRRERWLRAVNTLDNDPQFADAEAARLLELEDDVWRDYTDRFYKKLSSGHKIVLLTITKLVELVDERTLVLIDEPEGHLHPPLLSAFIRSLTDLLKSRNGVAIIATHSPVVLQEVPRSCVWLLRRSGLSSVAEQPEIETFGENVGVLTREVFGLEVTTAGFHKLLSDAIAINDFSYEELIGHFNGELGAEGRAIARSIIASRNQGV